MTDLTSQGLEAIRKMTEHEEGRAKAQAVRDQVMRQMYDGGKGMTPPEIGRALGVSTSLVRYTVCAR
jgi:hypothetical protein